MTTNEQLQILASVLGMLNRLGHNSTGDLRDWAFKAKAIVASELIVRDWAVVDCTRPNGTVGLTVAGKKSVHVQLRSLEPEARARVRRQIRFVPATAPLAEFLDLSQLEPFRRAVDGRG